MKKEKLLKLIDKAILIEEDSVSTISKHLDAAAGWTSCSKDEIAKIRITLDRLGKDSQRHKATLESLKKRIISENKNDY